MKEYGPYVSGAGYLFVIRCFDDGTRKSIYLHREILEKKIGRKLTDGEICHHKNGNRWPSDGNLVNLALSKSAVCEFESHLGYQKIWKLASMGTIRLESGATVMSREGSIPLASAMMRGRLDVAKRATVGS